MHKALVQLRLATKQDEPYVWLVYQDAMRGLIEKVWGWNDQWQAQNFRKQLKSCQTWLVLFDGLQSGYVQIEAGGECVFIDMLALEPEYRSKGIGPKVIDTIEHMHENVPLKLKCLIVNMGAYRFYMKNGFKVIDRDEVFYTLVKSV